MKVKKYFIYFFLLFLLVKKFARCYIFFFNTEIKQRSNLFFSTWTISSNCESLIDKFEKKSNISIIFAQTSPSGSRIVQGIRFVYSRQSKRPLTLFQVISSWVSQILTWCCLIWFETCHQSKDSNWFELLLNSSFLVFLIPVLGLGALN